MPHGIRYALTLHDRYGTRLLGFDNAHAVKPPMRMKKLVIGIASQQAIRARALAIARGDHQPRSNEPKIWFTSMRSLAEVLSDDNRALLRLIREQKPESLSQLAEFTGRAPSNLSRTLKTMERYGLVEMRRTLRNVQPVATASEFVIQAARGRRFK